MILKAEKLAGMLIQKATDLAQDCQKVFVAVSGGADSSLIAAILCKAFGPMKVVGMYRDIKSNPKHLEDVKLLQSVLRFKLINIDANPLYDEFLKQTKEQFELLGLAWAEEGSPEAEERGFKNAYASLKSRLTTPMAGFIAKAISNGGGRIFGTGNGEEDGMLRYFDKYGDGAVDNNVLDGLTKAEVKQLARYFGVPERIITKIPSADLHANGDAHNDEEELTKWAHKLGYNINLSYGAPDGSEEGNIAWAWKQDIKFNVIKGVNFDNQKFYVPAEQLKTAPYNYTKKQTQLILFLRQVEKITRHKVEQPCGLKREILIKAGVVNE
ncbi:NAD(+) synthase [Patescibacteria group bacterium]|nr:NAD(+) synthase [Patescibacteria group bacterium]MBU0879525.1 NAD(+) synthase [Patescibacteria group bacterium]MBU0880386.1 NAD(+) synthase [Patescibacteria group bacterium]MBU0897776.1 NAD(+) synthase [Patescibacteria group bacterium]MBU1062820.1 NAD(+) synthase [Patescibacteria group bacterium]